MNLPSLWEYRSQQEGEVAALAAREALAWCEELLKSASSKPLCILEVEGLNSQFFAPSFSFVLRQALERGHLIWVKTPADLAAKSVGLFLESGLCAGVLLRGEPRMNRAVPASLWSRRWRLCSDKGGTPFLWWHHMEHPALFSFDVRVEWSTKGQKKVLKDRRFFEKEIVRVS